MKWINKIVSLLCVLSFCVLALALPANAAQMDPKAINPADYIVDVVYDGENKTVYYNFDDIYWYVIYEDDAGYSDESGIGYLEFPITEDVQYGGFTAYPLGWSDYFPAPDNTLYIGDISPGADLSYSYDLWLTLDLINWDDYPDVEVYISERCYMWDEDLNYIGYLQSTAYGENGVQLESLEGELIFPGECLTVSGTFPSYAAYIRPVVYVDFGIFTTQDYYGHQTYCKFSTSHFDLSVDIDAVKSDSALMTAINNKLDLIGGQLDDIGDKLDSIDGALNADGDIDPDISDFSGAADDINNAMQSAGTVMNAGSDSVSDIVNSSAMTGTIQSLASGLSVAFSDEFQINLCGMSFNPFALWVTVIGGFSLIALTVAYLFRKRGQ